MKSTVYLTVLAILTGCVSVSLPSKNVVQKARVHVRAPRGPFHSFHSDRSDQAWRHPGNGNSISYFSNCHESADPTLQALRRDMLSGIENVEILSSENLQYNGREALRSLAQGKVDGVQARMDLLVFKKNNCIFGLSYVGLNDHFESDRAAFDSFLQGFEAP